MRSFSTLLLLLVLCLGLVAGPVNVGPLTTGNYGADGSPAADNDFTAGLFGGLQYRNFFVFDLSAVSGTVNSATLRLYNGTIASPTNIETYTLFEVSTSPTVFSPINSRPFSTTIYNDLGSGLIYGSQNIDNTMNNSFVDIVLSTQAINAIQAALGSQLAIGGAVTSISGPANQYVFLSGTTQPQTLILDIAGVTGGGTEPPPETAETPEITTLATVAAGLAYLAYYRRMQLR